MTEELKIQIAELSPNESLVIGDFPSKEIASEFLTELKRWIKKAQREGILKHQYLLTKRRNGTTFVVVVFCYEELTIRKIQKEG